MQHSLFEKFLDDVSQTARSGEVALALNSIASPVSAERGQMAALGNAGDMLIYVGSGSTKLIASASGGREQIVAFHFKGDLVSVPSNAWHSYGLCALVDAEMLTFPTEEFHEITAGDASFQNALLQRSLTALHRCRDKAVGLGRKSAQERVASFLVGMAERIGQQEETASVLDLPMSRRDVGDSLGLTIETISRQIGDLRKAGLIETEGRSRVVLLNPALLAERAGHSGEARALSG